MYHSVTFVGGQGTSLNDEILISKKNTWDDWALVAKERPFIAPPTPKTNFVDIPGSSTKLDFSEAITGYPTFENRTGSIEFTLYDQYLSGQEKLWKEKYSQIMSYISGRHMKMILEDDPNYFYEGRFYVDSYKPGSSVSDSFSTISINYDVGPYKWSTSDSLDSDWLWDPFSFVDGVILSSLVRNIPVTTEWGHTDLTKEVIGTAPLCPEFIVTMSGGTNMDLWIMVYGFNQNGLHDLLYQKSITVQAGNTTAYDMIFYADPVDPNSQVHLMYKTETGSGTLSLRYRMGGL